MHRRKRNGICTFSHSSASFTLVFRYLLRKKSHFIQVVLLAAFAAAAAAGTVLSTLCLSLSALDSDKCLRWHLQTRDPLFLKLLSAFFGKEGTFDFGGFYCCCCCCCCIFLLPLHESCPRTFVALSYRINLYREVWVVVVVKDHR